VGSDGGGDGGGIRIHLGGNPTVTNCIFIDNIAEPGGDGGGIFNGASTTTVINSVFSGNTARTGGAILCQGGTMTITTCTFSGNSASNVAGAVYCSTDVVTIANSVLWHNSPNEITGSVVATYSDVEGSWPGEGNIDEEPLFVDPENCDLRLQPGSPCIDAGDTTAVPCGLFVDLEGLGRVLDHRSVPDTGVPAALVPVTVDMGAYEFHLRGDINGDGAVNGLDVQPFVEAILTP
jgi:predicted outer membrane repeat protein